MTPAALVCWLVILSSPVLIRRLAPEPVRLRLRVTALWLPWCAAACALCLLPIARGLYHMAGALCLEPAVFALLGNAAGAYPRKSAGR